MKLSAKQSLTGLVLLAFVLRGLFTIYGAPVYYGMAVPNCYAFGDSISYMWAAENFINYGHFTFDFLEPDAAFGRLPGYPLFYGLQYFMFGPSWTVYTVAWSQVIIDSLAVLVIYAIGIAGLFAIANG